MLHIDFTFVFADIDDCESQPCQNNGICHDRLNGFYCECPSFWEGVTCQLGE